MSYTKEDIQRIVDNQRVFFKSGKTLDVNWRKEQLKKLRSAIETHEQEMAEALALDLGRTKAESYLFDIGSTIYELNETIHGLSKWARPETHFSGFMCFPSVLTKVYKAPYGVSLIIAPFNFPFLLSLGVLVASISAGNTAVIKLSSKSSNCTEVTKKLIAETFPEEYITVIDGGHDVADYCLETRVDKIFYTGSPNVAKHVMAEASKNLTPVALELGGETGNWCVVRKDADLKDAARKIAFFKIANSGQICVNINQVAVAEEVADKFIEYLKAEFIRQIGEKPLENPEYGKLIAKRAYENCESEVEEYRDRVVFGGHGNIETLQYEPTIIYPVNVDEHIVNHELFCPILPIVPYKDNEIDKLIDLINDREHGLALYLFTKDIKWANKVMSSSQFGGGCINEVLMHLMVKGVPFNGTGHSGMGAYHGEWGFREFSHPTTVLRGSNHFNLALREHPYNGITWKDKLMRFFER